MYLQFLENWVKTTTHHSRFAILIWLSLSAAFVAWAQPAQPPPVPQAGREPVSDPLRPNYVLGPNDQIIIHVPQAEEINDKPFRLDTEGFIDLPLVWGSGDNRRR